MGPRSLALVLAVLPTAGCWLLLPPNDDGGSEGPPCVDDISGCFDDTSKFMEDPTCELQGELELQLGEGETVFSPLAPGELPELHYGFQGGQHVWMAVQVKNPDLERQQLKIRVSAEYCNQNCAVESSWASDNNRELLADETTVSITPEGWIEQTRMLVTVFDWVDASHRRIEMVVTDPCGRQGYVSTSTF